MFYFRYYFINYNWELGFFSFEFCYYLCFLPLLFLFFTVLLLLLFDNIKTETPLSYYLIPLHIFNILSHFSYIIVI